MKIISHSNYLIVVVIGALLSSPSHANTDPVNIALKESSYFHETRVELPLSPEFKQDGDSLQVILANDFVIDLDIKAISLRITSPENIVLAENTPGKIFTGLEYIPEGVGPEIKPYSADLDYKFQRATSLGESVTFHFQSMHENGGISEVEWTFVPVRYIINGKTFDGVADQYYIKDMNHYLHEVWTSWQGPTGDDYNGASTFRHACYDKEAYIEVEFGSNKPQQKAQDWGMFIDGGQMFHLIGLGSGRGSIVEFMDEPVACRSGFKSNAYNNAVEVYYGMYIGRVMPDYTTPLRVRLLTTEPISHNLWLELTRYMKIKFQKEYSTKPTTPAPIVVDRNSWRDTTFEDYFKEWLPIYHEYGYRRVEIGWIWHRGRTLSSAESWPPLQEWTGSELIGKGHSQTDINGVVTKNSGGIESLAKAVEFAHNLDMEIFIWHQTAHGWRGSPDVRYHPEWVSYNYNGTMQGWGSDNVPTIWFSLQSGWKDVAIDRLKKLKKDTNIDGLWFDVYGAGASCNYREDIATFSIEDRSDYMRQIRDMGYSIYTEGVSLESVDSYVIYDKDMESYQNNPFILYGSSPYRTGKTIFYGKVDLFKLMSYQCFPHDRKNIWMPDESERINQTAYSEEVKYRNHCFNEITDHLGDVIGVLETDAGTQWICEKGNALFVWENSTLRISSESPRELTKIITQDGAKSSITSSGDNHWEIQAPSESVIILNNYPANIERLTE